MLSGFVRGRHGGEEEMKSLRMLGLVASMAMALVALLGVGAAQGAEFHTSEEGAVIFGPQTETHTITIEGSTVSCKTADLSGEASETTFAELELDPEYAECTAFGFAGAHLTKNGCKLKVHASGALDIECPEGKSITISVSGPFNTKCHVDIPSQTDLTNVWLFTNTPGSVIGLAIALFNLEYKVTESTGFCPLTKGEGENGEYEGVSELTADGGETEFWWTE
jgi:hypothetical protein